MSSVLVYINHLWSLGGLSIDSCDTTASVNAVPLKSVRGGMPEKFLPSYGRLTPSTLLPNDIGDGSQSTALVQNLCCAVSHSWTGTAAHVSTAIAAETHHLSLLLCSRSH